MMIDQKDVQTIKSMVKDFKFSLNKTEQLFLCRIEEFEALPKPVRKPLNDGDKYFTLNLQTGKPEQLTWRAFNEVCDYQLEQGLVYLTQKDSQTVTDYILKQLKPQAKQC